MSYVNNMGSYVTPLGYIGLLYVFTIKTAASINNAYSLVGFVF
jgi:hypothetical protein